MMHSLAKKEGLLVGVSSITILFPKWFVVPQLGKAHCSDIYNGVFCQKRFQILFEAIVGVNRIQQISYTT